MRQLAISGRTDSDLARATVIAGVLTASAAAWAALTARMAGMDSGPGGDPGAVGWFAVTWLLMTAAMMLPASVPAVMRVVRAAGGPGPAVAILFLAGYVAVWMLAGLVGYSLIEAIRGIHLSVLGWSSAGRYLAGAAVVGAGLYQLTGLKGRWLARCTAPERHRSSHGRVGALLTGVEHGGCCVACCWTLMVALYALGMMSITWTIVLAILIVGERLLPRRLTVHAVAAGLLVLGLAVTASPAAVPALTIPSPAHSMTMGMPKRMSGARVKAPAGRSAAVANPPHSYRWRSRPV